MKVVITGGTGFLGLRLARKILERRTLTGASGQQEPVEQLILFDAVTPAERPAGLDDRVTITSGDVADEKTIMGMVNGASLSVFHLASVVSAGAEQDFDLALEVNLDGGLNLLEACRAAPGLPRFVFTSSLAVFGGAAMPAEVGDDTKITPQNTYGMTKVINELLVNDYTRKGFLDGRGARLPTTVIRPGKPNKAASSFASGVFREPLSGNTCNLPVRRDTKMAIGGYRGVVDGMIALHEADNAAIGDDRTVNFPSIATDVEGMIAALKRVASDRKLGEIIDAPDPVIQSICEAWPSATRFDRATALGIKGAPDLDIMVRAYIEDYLDA
ncbi:MAG: NAD-dependent epimerase/dehydratase family protein [Alphaproteobacteria bacterium]|jgi:D-erythronate 2-dehydrogenase|nr:NAD-dependent epimerase/dehydratase family protein [Alphaproteobacteria bacterium]